MSDEWIKVGAKAAICRESRHYAGEFQGYTRIVRLTTTQIITREDGKDYDVKWRRKDLKRMDSNTDVWRRPFLAPPDDSRVWRSLYFQEISDVVIKINSQVREAWFNGSDVPKLMERAAILRDACSEAHDQLAKIYAREQESGAA